MPLAAAGAASRSTHPCERFSLSILLSILRGRHRSCSSHPSDFVSFANSSANPFSVQARPRVPPLTAIHARREEARRDIRVCMDRFRSTRARRGGTYTSLDCCLCVFLCSSQQPFFSHHTRALIRRVPPRPTPPPYARVVRCAMNFLLRAAGPGASHTRMTQARLLTRANRQEEKSRAWNGRCLA